jgi:hypothetical protein
MKLKSVYKLITEGNININFGVFYNFFKSPEVKEKILSTRINEIPNLLETFLEKNFGIKVNFSFEGSMYDPESGKIIAAKPKNKSPLIGGSYSPSSGRLRLHLTTNGFNELLHTKYNQFVHTLIYMLTHEILHGQQYQRAADQKKHGRSGFSYYNNDGTVNLQKYLSDPHEIMAYAITAAVNLYNAKMDPERFNKFISNPGPSSLVYKSSYVIRLYYKYCYLTKNLKVWDKFIKYLMKYYQKYNWKNMQK